jgi:hypothetical protein
VRPPRPILAYVNGHGFGHATRCIAVMQEIWRARPQQPVWVRTSAPAFLFEGGRGGPLRVLRGEVDPGTLQADPLTLDVEASLAARAAFQEEMPLRVAAEIDRLGGERVGLVLGDIPPLAFEVARALGVPGIALGNFSWDWIYEPYVVEHPDRAPLVDAMRRSYGLADLLLRLPLHAGLTAFRRTEDLPLVVHLPVSGREEVRRALGLTGEARPVVVVSFGGFAAVRFDATQGSDPGDVRFVTFGDGVPGLPDDAIRLPVDHPYRHADLVGAADAVITKPGYGTVAECLACRTPFLYAGREHFREYDVLVAAIERDARARFLPRADLLRLSWRHHLEALLADRRPWAPVRTDGGAVAARRLLELLDAS